MADQIIDITVNQIVEEVTLNVTPDIIEINVNSITNDTSKISGSGTTNYIPKFTGASAIGNSNITDNGTVVAISTDATINGVNIGRGAGSISTNTRVGTSALNANTTGGSNLAIGQSSLTNNTTGNSNTGIGQNALSNNNTGSFNTAIGFNSLVNLTGTNGNNTAIGVGAGRFAGAGTTAMTSVNNSIYVGFQSRGLNATSSTNEIVIGYDSVGLGSNTTVLGNSSTTTTAIYGKVGIGTTSPASKLTINTDANSNANAITIYSNNTTAGAYTSIGSYYANGNTNVNSQIRFGNEITNGGEGYLALATGASSATERMRITSGGDVFIGATSAANVEKLGVTYNSQDRLGFVLNDTYTGAATSQIAIQFRRNGSAIGSVTTTTTTTAYNITSDYRLKQDFKPFNGLDLVSKIKVYDYKWKSDNSRMNGVIAHELQEVVPYAVTGEKDAKEMQGVDYSKLVPILVQAIQELNEKINKLENK